ncbi:hypothetical protein [Glycomyces dulcitolivorans]|uniref:hypothetical protein n=1 Tax=Glycomyces dulcitolivorans TaxID=2200759 RepID=UPI000DD41C4A|nr:hypothetical protein [Glycomyces dulcitolivorans]
MNEDSGFDLFGGARIGNMQIGVVGSGATVTIGAMGDGARGYVGAALEPRGAEGRHRREAGRKADPVGSGH